MYVIHMLSLVETPLI